MCCFNVPVSEVNKTKILVAPTKAGRQVTVYENVVGVTGGNRGGAKAEKQIAEIKEKQAKAKYENAMLLPCPLKDGQDVQLLDLSKDSFKFDRIKLYFPEYVKPASRGREKKSKSAQSVEKNLVVHEVGAYFVSIAKNYSDLDRIDPTVFKVSPTITQLFGQHYKSGFGFIVCCFNPEKKIDPHPIGYVHDLLPDGRMFVPCRHEHGHGTKPMEKFDHEIYSLNSLGEVAGHTREELLAKNPAADGEEHEEKATKPEPSLIRVGIDESHGGKWQLKPNAPATPSAAINSPLLAQHLPDNIKSFRQRLIQGSFKNDDLIFALA